MYLIFVVFVLCFAFLVPPIEYYCDGRVVVVDNTVSKIISTVYRLLMAILGLVLGVGFLTFGTQLYCSVKDAKFATDKFKRTVCSDEWAQIIFYNFIIKL